MFYSIKFVCCCTIPVTSFKILHKHNVYFGNLRSEMGSMGSRVGKSKSSVLDKARKEIEEQLDETLEHISLKNVPLEERRREAQKPLYLTRYE
jgi:hypothetical protein